MKKIIDGFKGFVISIKEMLGQDVSDEKAQIEGYKDSLSKEKVDGMMNGLSPYIGGALDTVTVAKKEGLAKFIEGTGVPLVYTSENGRQQIMIAPQVMEYVFEGNEGKLPDILGTDSEAWQNIQAVRGKYISRDERKNLTDIPATERVKEIFTIEEENRGYYIGRANNEPDIPDRAEALAGVAPIPIEEAKTSVEVQKTELRAQAINLDDNLKKAQTLPEGTPEERNTKETAVKSAQEAITQFKEERKNTILSVYTDIKDRIKEGEIERDTLTDINSPEPSEIEKRRVVQENLTKLRVVETAMKAKIEEVMTQNGDTWEIKDGVNAEKMVSIETTIRAIENNTASIENRELSEEEKDKQETEKKEKMEENQKLLSTNTIISSEKMKIIEEYLEKYPNPDLQEKFEVMKSKIELVKITVKKKNDMKEANRFINWNNEDENSRGGWVEIDDSYSGGSALEDISWLELDADGFAEVDWQLVRGDNYHVKKVGGLFNARNILNANKEIIKKSDDSENLKID